MALPLIPLLGAGAVGAALGIGGTLAVSERVQGAIVIAAVIVVGYYAVKSGKFP